MATTVRELTQRAKSSTVRDMGGGNVQQFFEANKKAIEAALPKHMTPDRMLKVAMHAIRTTPALMECNAASLMGAIIQASSLGLEPNTVMGHAYLVPFWNGREKRKEAQLIPGYKGLVDLARRSGQIQSIIAEPIYREEIEAGAVEIRRGTDGYIRHDTVFDLDPEVAKVAGFYAVAHFTGGGYQFEFMTAKQVDRVRDGSQGYQNAVKYKKDHPWISHYVQMGRKTVIRRLANYLPLSVEFATATALDGMAEAGKSQGLDKVLEGDYQVAAQDAPAQEQTEAPAEEAPSEEATEETHQAQAPEHYIEAINAVTDIDTIDQVMDEASGVLTGQQKASVTKAYKARKEALAGDQSQGDFL